MDERNETAAEILERVSNLKRRAVDLYMNDHRFRAQVNTAVSQAMNDHGRIDPERAEQAACDIAKAAVVLTMSMILDEDAELRHTRQERDYYRDAILQMSALRPGIPIYATTEGPKETLQGKRK